MKTVSIRELHLATGRWVRVGASEPVVVTDHGREVAVIEPFDPARLGQPLPDREARIRKRSRLSTDSVVLQSEMRDRA